MGRFPNQLRSRIGHLRTAVSIFGVGPRQPIDSKFITLRNGCPFRACKAIFDPKIGLVPAHGSSQGHQ
jgi:hypothetical protein